MRLARFNEDGYEYFYHSSDETVRVSIKQIVGHEALFGYASYDLAKLEKALEAYVLKKLDIGSLTIKEDYIYTASDTEAIEKEYNALHPVFIEASDADILAESIADSLNRLLVKSEAYVKILKQIQILINEDKNDQKIDDVRKPYFDLLKEIWPELKREKTGDMFECFISLREKNAFQEKCYSEFLNMSPPLEPISEDSPFLALEPVRDIGYMVELKKDQALIREMLRLLLDADGPLKKASPSQRSQVFSEYFNRQQQDLEEQRGFSWMSVEESFTFYNPPKYGFDAAGLLPAGYAEAAAKKYTVCDSTPPEILEALARAEEAAIKAVKGETYREYKNIKDPHQLMFLEILGMINRKPRFKLRRCNNLECRRYFSPKSLKTKYCTETCLKTARQRKYADANKLDLLLRRAQGTFHKFLERHKEDIDKNAAKDMRKEWNDNALKKLKEFEKDGSPKAAEEFGEWLKCEQMKLKKKIKDLNFVCVQ